MQVGSASAPSGADASSGIMVRLLAFIVGLIASVTVGAIGPGKVTSDVEPAPVAYGVPVATNAIVVNHTFGNSYGTPVTAAYIPPNVDFDRVTITLDLSTSETQYDRLVHVFLDNVELWRPSTPEPYRTVVVAEYTKDVSGLLAAFEKPGELVFELDNTITDRNRGEYLTTLTLNFYHTGSRDVGAAFGEEQWYYDEAATAVRTLQPERLQYLAPPDPELAIPQLPRNTTRAVLQVFASGNADEEFWWANGNATGPGATRVVQLEIDGEVAGLVAPYQNIYTGGVNPNFWYPYVAIRAYDVPSYYVDVTPFLPRLWERETTLAVHASNFYNHVPLPQDWIENVALLTWEVAGVSGSGTFESAVIEGVSASWDDHIIGENLNVTEQQNYGYANFNYTLTTSANLQFSGSAGERLTGNVEWTQTAEHTNVYFSDNHDNEYIASVVVGHDTATLSGTSYAREFTYPLFFYEGDTSAAFDHGYAIDATAPHGRWQSNTTQYSWLGHNVAGAGSQVVWSSPAGTFTRVAVSANHIPQHDATTAGDSVGGLGSGNLIVDRAADVLVSAQAADFDAVAAKFRAWPVPGPAAAAGGNGGGGSSGGRPGAVPDDLPARPLPQRRA